MASTVDRIHDLPNEVLENIMLGLENPIDLRALVDADTQARVLFEARPQLILQNVVENRNSFQIQKLAGAVMCRHIASLKPLDSKDLHRYLYHHVQSSIPRSIFGTDSIHVSAIQGHGLAVLHNFADIYSQVETAVRSFIVTTLPKPADRIRNEIERQGLSKPFWKDCPLEGRLEQSPSPTESHRIRRAFWRLYLYFELFHGIDENGSSLFCDNFGYRGYRAQKPIFKQLSQWERAELDCAYHHLKFHSEAWRRPCPECKQMVLPDTYSAHQNKRCTETWRNEELSNFKSRKLARADCVYEYQEASRRFAQDPEDLPVPFADWLEGHESDKANAGWQYAQKQLTEYRCSSDEEEPYGCFLDWGYCMWDQSRLERWHLVDIRSKKLVAVDDWWKDTERKGGERCAHSWALIPLSCEDLYPFSWISRSGQWLL